METGENFTALNYSAHAIESMKEVVQRLPRILFSPSTRSASSAICFADQ